MSPLRELWLRLCRWWHGPTCEHCGAKLDTPWRQVFGLCFACDWRDCEEREALLRAIEDAARTPKRLIHTPPDAGARRDG
jgi:hypothetical protein